MAQRLGGSFAPQITDDKLEEYRQLAGNVHDQRCSEYMIQLVEMLDMFNETPESSLPGTKHPLAGMVVPLEDAEIKRIWDKVPYMEECDLIGKAFDILPPGEQRHAAYHLLLYARELTLDREPMTQERVGFK